MKITPQRFSVLAWVALIWALGFPDIGLAKSPLIFGSLAGSPPLSFRKDGVVTGFFSDVFLESVQRTEYSIILKPYPPKRISAYLKTGKIDGAVAMVKTKERENHFMFSTTPIMSSRSLVFVKKGHEFPFHSIQDLHGKRAGILLGWKVMNSQLEKAISKGMVRTETVTKHEQNLKKLIRGRVDCLIATENLTWFYAHQLGLSDKIVALPLPVNEVSAYFAISTRAKNISHPTVFMKTLNAALDAIIADGTYEKIKKKYNLVTINPHGIKGHHSR